MTVPRWLWTRTLQVSRFKESSNVFIEQVVLPRPLGNGDQDTLLAFGPITRLLTLRRIAARGFRAVHKVTMRAALVAPNDQQITRQQRDPSLVSSEDALPLTAGQPLIVILYPTGIVLNG